MGRLRARLLAAGLALVVAGALAVSMMPVTYAASEYDCPGQKLAALTFDDGPGPYSEQILDSLRDHGAKATFFMNGYKLWTYPDAVRRMAQEGHQVANHTYNHPYLAQCTDEQIRQELSSTAQALTSLTGLTGTGETGFYMRPPFFSYDQRVLAVSGVPVVWCTVDSSDWKYQSADRLVSYVSRQLKDGGIVLMHETVKSTAQGIGSLVDALKAQGYELVTVEELFWRRGITPQPSTYYTGAPNTGINRCARELYFDESKLDTHWAYESICYVKEKGLMTGNAYGEFTPNFPLTRGMFVTILGRMDGVEAAPTDTGFSDVPQNHYAAAYVAWAKENGIMIGVGEGQFGVDQPITRQELAVTLARYGAMRGMKPEPFDLTSYKDHEQIAEWAKQGVADCSSLGWLKGVGENFLPLGNTTRAMGAVILQRLCETPFPGDAQA